MTTATATPLQVREARRPVPVLYLPLIALGTVAYGTLAWLNPFLSESPLTVLLLSMLFLIVTSFIVMNTNKDALDPFRVISVYYLMCFCISPLLILEPEWHFSQPLGPLAVKSSLFLIAGYLMTAFGYYFPAFRRIPDQIRIGELRANRTLLSILGLMLFAIGEICLLIVFIRAGGVGTILGSAEGRNFYLQGLGIFVWPALFSFTGGVLYYAASMRRHLRHAWIYSWPLWISAASWIVFQSRMKVLNVLVMGLLMSHYLWKPMRATRLAVYGMAGFVFVVAVGFARNTQRRALVLSDPAALASALFDHFWEFSHATFVGSFSRLRQIMLIFDKVPDWMPYDWGASLLMVFNPVLRLVGLDHVQFSGIGPRLFKLAHPQLEVDLATGYLSSLPGEFLVNFPFYIAIFMFPIYGMVLRFTYNRLILKDADPASVAIYSILVLAFANMIFASCGQNIFELLVLWLPALAAVKVAELAAPRAAPSFAATGFAQGRPRPGAGSRQV